MQAKISVVLQTYAREHGIDNSKDLAVHLGVPRETCREWWIGKNVPRNKVHRQKLFELTGDAIFKGKLTSENKRAALSPPKLSTEDQECVQRTVYLILGLFPDLRKILASEDDQVRFLVREKIKEMVGSKAISDFSMMVRALTTEMARKQLISDKMLDLGVKHE